MIHIDQKKCTKCGTCTAVCPGIVIEKVNGNYEFVHKNSCIMCYHCVAVCPAEAVTCDAYPLSAFPKIGKTAAAAPAEVRELLMRRRSVREFKNKEIPRKTLEQLMEIAVHAPTGSNSQAVGFSVITNRELINKMDRKIMTGFSKLATLVDNPIAVSLVCALAGKKAGDKIVGTKDSLDRYMKAGEPKSFHVFRGAPALIVAHAGGDSSVGKDDCIIALAHVNMAAESMGLGATWIGYLVAAARIDPSLKKHFGVPANRSLHAAMILGWPKYKYKRAIPRKSAGVKWIE